MQIGKDAMKRITIKDIARELGIHHSTVSRALRSSPDVKPETIEKVVRYAAENGYQINLNALHLRGKGSNILGVIVPNIHHSFFSNFVSNITRLAYAAGYIVSVFQSEESVNQEKEIIKSIIRQNVAGVIVSLSMETVDVSHFKLLDQYKIPLVCFDRISPLLIKPSVVLDNESTLMNVLIRLNSMGYSKIAYLSGVPTIHLFKERQNGYRLGLKAINGQYEKCITVADGFTLKQGFDYAKQLFSERVKPDALVFDSHFLALGTMNYLKENMPKLLDNIGIASFGGFPWLSFCAPNTLVIQQPEEKMAIGSFDLLRSAILNPENNEIKTLKFQATLI